MNLSITTDYFTSYGSPEPYLQRISEAGFSHIHWCHHWDTDFLYANPEIVQIKRWLDQFSLQTLNIHASHGREKRWDSIHDYERLAGVELVRNRLEMAAELNADVIILHAAAYAPLAQQLRSLAELEPYARLLGVRIAVENLSGLTFQRLGELFSEFPPDFLGLCYDTGHGNMQAGSLDHLERMKDRLIALHIHDNDGNADQHKLPYTGTIDWARFIGIVKESVYDKLVNLEVVCGEVPVEEEQAFLCEAHKIAAGMEAALA